MLFVMMLVIVTCALDASKNCENHRAGDNEEENHRAGDNYQDESRRVGDDFKQIIWWVMINMKIIGRGND